MIKQASKQATLTNEYFGYLKEAAKYVGVSLFKHRIKSIGEISNIYREASPRPISQYMTNEETGINWKTLGEICDVRDGTHNTPSKQNVGKYLVTSKNIKNGSVTFENAYYISEIDFELINKRSKVDINDLLFTMIGTVGEIAHITEEPDYAIKNLGLIKTGDRILSRYLYHYLQTADAKKYISDNKSKGSQVFLSLGKIRDFPIPYVNSKIQYLIVEILDNFESISKDLNIGLPKEIELRQTQYEYYRDTIFASFVKE